jgi:hypothetical protein
LDPLDIFVFGFHNTVLEIEERRHELVRSMGMLEAQDVPQLVTRGRAKLFSGPLLFLVQSKLKASRDRLATDVR